MTFEHWRSGNSALQALSHSRFFSSEISQEHSGSRGWEVLVLQEASVQLVLYPWTESAFWNTDLVISFFSLKLSVTPHFWVPVSLVPAAPGSWLVTCLCGPHQGRLVESDTLEVGLGIGASTGRLVMPMGVLQFGHHQLTEWSGPSSPYAPNPSFIFLPATSKHTSLLASQTSLCFLPSVLGVETSRCSPISAEQWKLSFSFFKIFF